MATEFDLTDGYPGCNDDAAAAQKFAAAGKYFAAGLIHQNIMRKFGEAHPRHAYHRDLAALQFGKALAAHKRRESLARKAK